MRQVGFLHSAVIVSAQYSTVIHSRQLTGGKHNAYNDALTPFQTRGDDSEVDERRGIGCTVEPVFLSYKRVFIDLEHGSSKV
jgi:hypothetical protein